MRKPTAVLILTSLFGLFCVQAFAEVTPVCRGLDGVLRTHQGQRFLIGRSLGTQSEDKSIYDRLKFCAPSVWMYASATNREENDSFDYAPLSAPGRSTDQKRLLSSYVTQLNDLRKAWGTFVDKAGALSQDAQKLKKADDPAKPLAAADKLKLFDALIVKEGEPLDPAGEKAADEKSVKGGTRFQELDAAAWDMLKCEVFKKHPEARKTTLASDGKPLFANPKAFLELMAKVDPKVKEDMDSRFKHAREVLNDLNAKVKEGGTLDAIRQGLGRQPGAAGSTGSTGPAAPVVQQPKTMEEMEKQTLPGQLDAAVLSKVFEGMKQRNELPADQTQQQWESQLNAEQRAKLLEDIKGKEGRFISYKGQDGKDYHRFFDGTTVAGDRIEVPQGQAPDKAATDAWVDGIAKDLVARRDMKAVLGGIRQAAGEVTQKPGAALNEAIKQGAPASLAALPIEANTQKEVLEKSHANFSKQASERSAGRQKAEAGYLQKVADAKKQYEARMAAANDPGILKTPAERKAERDQATADYKKAIDTAAQAERTSYSQYQQAETTAKGQEGDEAAAIKQFYRTEVTRQLQTKIIPRYKDLKAARAVHPALGSQTYLDQYVREEWTEQAKLDEKIKYLSEHARGSAQTGVRESDLDDYFKKDLRRWVDATLKGQQSTYTPPETPAIQAPSLQELHR